MAFTFTWLGREAAGGRSLVKVGLEPRPGFRARTSRERVLQSVRATIWIDEAERQLVRGELEVTRDVGFAGGLLGALRRGARWYRSRSRPLQAMRWG